MTAREAGTPPRLICSNPLLSACLFGATTRTRANPRPARLLSQKECRGTRAALGDAAEVGAPTERPRPRPPFEPDTLRGGPETWLGAQVLGAPGRFMTASPRRFAPL